jgi:hypothetical protein
VAHSITKKPEKIQKPKTRSRINSLFKCAQLKCGLANTLNATSYYQTAPLTRIEPPYAGNLGFDQARINLIGRLIDLESDFLNYMSNGVSTFSRPLRGFFLQQQDYFMLFQNIEKLFVICENFLNSMQKWTALDVYKHVGEFFSNKIKLLSDPLTTYVKGHSHAKMLLTDLQLNSKKFGAFLKVCTLSRLALLSGCGKNFNRFDFEGDARLDIDIEQVY